MDGALITTAVVVLIIGVMIEMSDAKLLKKAQVGRIATAMCMIASASVFVDTPILSAFKVLVSMGEDLLAWVISVVLGLFSVGTSSEFNHGLAHGAVVGGSLGLVVFLVFKAAPKQLFGGSLSKRYAIFGAFAVPFALHVGLTGVKDAAAGPIGWTQTTINDPIKAQIPADGGGR